MTLFWLVYSRLADHCLELKRSTRETGDKNAAEKSKADLGKACTKILVRNIPFQVRILSSDSLTLVIISPDWLVQATKKEIMSLFRTFGELSAVRLPKKMTGDGDHRGFAFIEFTSVSDAKSAFSSLVHSSHLYGRRLVLEWAQVRILDSDWLTRIILSFDWSGWGDIGAVERQN